MSDPEIRLEQDHAAAAAEVTAALVAWNERQMGPRNEYHFTLSIRGNGGELLAGLVGQIFWTFLYVAVLWVDEEHHGRGFGQRLLEHAEQLATERSCDLAFLQTMVFQAPGFYQKCGYTQFGVLPWASEPLTRIWFAKRLGSPLNAQ